MPLTIREVMNLTRTLHIYLTLLALAALLFFGVTGFMLNHDDWFHWSQPRETTTDATLPTEPLARGDKLAIVEALRKQFAITAPVDSFDLDDDLARIVFKSPGRRAEAEVTRADGRTKLTTETRGLAGRLTDLHKGASTGAAWKWVIDATAILLVFASISGLILWTALPRRLALGIVALVVGSAAALVVYLALVP